VANASDLTQPVRLFLTWNQTVTSSRNGVTPATLIVLSAGGPDGVLNQTVTWPEVGLAPMGQPVQSVVLVNASVLGCTRCALDEDLMELLPSASSPFIPRRKLASEDLKKIPLLWRCFFDNHSVALPATLATLYNFTTLVVDVPAPLYKANATYKLTVPDTTFCARTLPKTCSLPFTLTFKTQVDPWDNLTPLTVSVSSIGVATVQTLKTAARSDVRTTTLQLFDNSVLPVAISFASAGSPSGVPLAFIIPADANALRLAMPSAAASLVGSSRWFGIPATGFQDRLVLHPDMLPIVTNLTVRYLSMCAFDTIVNSNATILSCQLPANTTGSLWRIYAGWAVPHPDGSLLLPRQLSLLPWQASTGAPLTLSFPFSSLTPGSTRRFPINSQGTRAVPFSFDPASQSTFDVSSSSMVLTTNPSMSALNAAIPAQSSEPLFVLGRLYLPCPTLQVYLGGPGAAITQSCIVDKTTDTWLVCTTAPLPDGKLGVKLPLWLWDSSSLVVASSADTFSYSYSPLVTNVTGCNPCPCVGNIVMTVTGANFFPILSVQVGMFQALSSSVVLTDTTNYTSFTFVMPAGSGVKLALKVTSGSATFTFPDAVSYHKPRVLGVQGCASVGLVAEVKGCQRRGGDTITLIGSDFGSAAPSVVVAGAECAVLNASQSFVACTLSAMPIGHALGNQILVVQSTGGVAFINLATAAVSYTPCPAGQHEDGIECTPCPIGTFSATSGSASCQPCEQGTLGQASGLSACSACQAGRYAPRQATACMLCPTGTFSVIPSAPACDACAAGKFTAQTGSTECSVCTAGTFAANSSCLPCATGMFSVAPGSSSCGLCTSGKFAARTGQTECDTCTVGVSTSAVGASTCTCLESFYSIGSSNGSTLCAACPPAAVCSSLDPTRSLLTLQSKVGQWRFVGQMPPVFFKCSLNPSACLSSANGTRR
jgi:hypothetical protein